MKNISLIVCDVQPDVTKKLQYSSQFVDLVDIAVRATRNSRTTASVNIVHTILQFSENAGGYDQIPTTHPKLGILRKLHSKNPQINWFTSSELCIPAAKDETVVSRTTYLPQATNIDLLEALSSMEDHDHEFVVIGYGPTVQAICNLLGDCIGALNVQIIKECVRDENSKRCQAFLDHGLLFREEVISLVDYIGSMDLLHERITDLSLSGDTNDDDDDAKEQTSSGMQKYVCDCGRGGHLSLFIFYLVRDYNYIEWPQQPWFQDITKQGRQYYCPLGRRVVDLCDEPQFSASTRFFNSGREWLDEKDKLHTLVPELMPPTFHTLQDAQNYNDTIIETTNSKHIIWFLKKVNQNGGRAVTVINELPTKPLEADEQIQIHIPRPLLYSKSQDIYGNEIPTELYKCHVKTYQWIGCVPNTDGTISWQLYMHDLYYLATAYQPWDPENLSDEVQITTMRTHRLYPDNPWRINWDLTKMCQQYMEKIFQVAVEQGKLQYNLPQTASTTTNTSSSNETVPSSKAALQFEINSADWMLDEDGKMYLIECNGIPVLYDPEISQPLLTKGLNLYDGLYKKNPKGAVVNDHDLLKEAIGLALKGKLPKSSLWKKIATIPSP